MNVPKTRNHNKWYHMNTPPHPDDVSCKCVYIEVTVCNEHSRLSTIGVYTSAFYNKKSKNWELSDMEDVLDNDTMVDYRLVAWTDMPRFNGDVERYDDGIVESVKEYDKDV